MAQERLRESILSLGLEPNLFPAGADLVKFRDVLQFARDNCSGQSFVWCNSDVMLTADPYALDDGRHVRGFHRRELPSEVLCGGVDMYLIPTWFWDEVLLRNVPDLWCGATHVDWWLTRAAVLNDRYTAHLGFIDHLSHATSKASKERRNPYYRRNVAQYNKWAWHHGAATMESRIGLPFVGGSFSPITDYWRRVTRRKFLDAAGRAADNRNSNKV